MPIYEYKCTKCKKLQEIWQKITEDALTKCPLCKGKIERQISASGFALKGTGWYKTDYERKPAKAESSESSSSDASSSDKGEKSDKPEKADKADKAEKSDAKPKAKAKGKPKSAD